VEHRSVKNMNVLLLGTLSKKLLVHLGNMKMILSTIVGSRLHGTHTEKSDFDYRGVFLAPLDEILSPFRDPKETHWIEHNDFKAKLDPEKHLDDTAYELRKFCKMAAQGNPSVLEVLVGEEYPILTEEGKVLRELLPAFLSQKCYYAFMGYSNNQEKKFRNPSISNQKGKDVLLKHRKYKYACAHIRTLMQLEHLLKEKELIGTYSPCGTEYLKQIKQGEVEDYRIMESVFRLEKSCEKLLADTWLPEKPDYEKIENFILSCYS
tara:strand:- start:1454 stop:2245 length:792 start_codon:yes stop_codon:yes gene_type:complete